MVGTGCGCISSTESLFNNICALIQVTVSKILHTRNAGVETWLTSDGRAYFVQLQETSHSEVGTSDLGYSENGEQVPKFIIAS